VQKNNSIGDQSNFPARPPPPPCAERGRDADAAERGLFLEDTGSSFGYLFSPPPLLMNVPLRDTIPC